MTESATPTALIVDDDAMVRNVGKRGLQMLGFQVAEADCADRALAYLRENAADLLLTDVRMPGELSGIDLAREALALRPGIKVILASGYADTLSEGVPNACQLLPKPYRRQQLRDVLEGLGF